LTVRAHGERGKTSLQDGQDHTRSGPDEAAHYPGYLTVFPSIMLPIFLAVVDQTIVATALPAIAADTGRVERASWVVVGYLIAATIAAPIYGRLGDAFGRRRLMFAALSVFMLASVLCALAPTIELLTAARVLQGLGGGGLMTLSQALIGEAVPPRDRARFQGYFAAVAVSANASGPVAGGYLTQHFGWESIFLVNVPIGLVAIALTLRLPVRRPDHPHQWRADPYGLLLFTVTVAAILLALERAQHVDLNSLPLAGALFVGGLIALALLIRQEDRAESPLIPLGLLRMPAIWRSDAMAVCHGAAMVSLITFLPVFLQTVRGASPSETGLLLLPLTLGIGAGSVVTGRLVSRTGLTTIFPTLGFAVVTCNLIVLALAVATLGATGLAALLFWHGLFVGTVMGVVQVTVQSAAGQARLGEASASVSFSRSIGAAFGTALVAFVLFAVLSLENPQAAQAFAHIVEQAGHAGPALTGTQATAMQADIVAAFRAAFLMMAGFTALGCVISLFHPMRRI
jgi:EmrB/QacA subfamily drug resistance transporter